MKKIEHSKLLSLIFVVAYILSACGGTLPQDINADDAISTLSAIASSTPALSGTSLPVASTTPQAGGPVEVEIFGVVESLTETTITVNGVTYNILADFTEFKDVISVGDQVKIHVIVNADGTFTIREIEISIGDDNDNANINSNVNSNDDNGNDSNSNDDNSNDDNSNDNGGNNNENNNDSSGPGSGGGNDNG